MASFEYDPNATYPNTGERGCSSLQVTRIRLHQTKGFADIYGGVMRYQVTVALPREQLEMLMLQDPEAFDDVKPVQLDESTGDA
jgi:hypothetical protein